MTLATLLFYVGGAGLLATALAVVLARRPLHGALWLILCLCHVALMYLLLDATFASAMQLLVYAGAIMVLFVFVIMLLNLQDSQQRPPYLAWSKVLGTVAIASIAYRIVSLVLREPSGPGRAVDGSVKSIGALLLTDYLFAFEAVSVVLLVAVVGAVVLGMRRLT